MNDVTALMGKLKANVSYLQFGDSMTEQSEKWPVLARAVESRKPAATESQPEPAVEPEAAAVAEPAPPVRAAGSLLRRYGAHGEPVAESRSALLSDIFARLERKGR
jgi:hypothetical protein